jgi:hypothetical protein
MERSALYRRALAPVMIFNGVLGSLAAIAGILARIESPPWFVGYWMIVGLLAVAASFLLARRQALKDTEPFWSPPTRRVAQALLPALFCGFVAGVIVLVKSWSESPGSGTFGNVVLRWLPVLWVALYGCALHAAGFFMPRGMKIFGWGLVLGAFCVALPPALMAPFLLGHGTMGLFFGLAHLACGIYLYYTEPRASAL